MKLFEMDIRQYLNYTDDGCCQKVDTEKSKENGFSVFVEEQMFLNFHPEDINRSGCNGRSKRRRN